MAVPRLTVWTAVRHGASFVVVAAALASSPAAREGGEAPSLKTVVERIGRYVDAYEPDLSTLVARERYTQTVRGFRQDPPRDRTLISDFLFLRLPGRDGPWLGFRDVIEVDGKPVERHEERLREIVGSSPGDAAYRAFQMSRESSLYNIGSLQRTVNVPVCVLGWMHPRLQDRFSFERDGLESVGGVSAWRIRFRERKEPTIVRDHLGKNVSSSGYVWVDPTDGRILQTEQLHSRGVLRVRIQVYFERNADFGILVPSRMLEQYLDNYGRLETEAVYSNYRRFGVTTRIR
jgi:hypothetical protein